MFCSTNANPPPQKKTLKSVVSLSATCHVGHRAHILRTEEEKPKRVSAPTGTFFDILLFTLSRNKPNLCMESQRNIWIYRIHLSFPVSKAVSEEYHTLSIIISTATIHARHPLMFTLH